MQRAVRWLVLPTLVALMSFGRPAPARAYRTTADLPGFEGSEPVVWAGASVELRLGAQLIAHEGRGSSSTSSFGLGTWLSAATHAARSGDIG